MPILAGIFSKKDRHPQHNSPPSKSKSKSAVGPSTIRVVNADNPNRSHAQPAQSAFTSEPSLPTDYVLPEINLLSADNGSPDDAISITASSSSAHPPSPSAAPSSSSMLRLVNPFRKKSTNSDTTSSNLPSGSLQSDKHETFLPPLRSSIFSALEGNYSSQSLPTDFPAQIDPQSLRLQPAPSRTLPLPIPKTPEIRTSTAIKVFNHNSKPSHSSKSSQDLQLTSPTQPQPQPHSPLAPQVDDSTFTLKSFRQVRPESPSPLEPPQFPSSIVGVGPRLRGLSNASDTSQRVTVAAFREAQARARTPTNIPDQATDGMLPVDMPFRPASPAGARPGTAFGTPPRPVRQLPPSSFGRNSPTPSMGRGRTQSPTPIPGIRSHNQSPVAAVRTPAPRAHSRLSNHRWADTSSEDETSSEGEDDGDATITKSGGGRERMINQRRVNEIGIGARPPIRNANGGSSSSSGSSAHGKAKSELGHGRGYGHSRTPSQEQQWPSASKSELGHGGSLAPISRIGLPGTGLPSSFSRGSFAPPTHPRLNNAGTETSENESSQSSDDDMPLSNLLPPRRPGSAMSGARSASPALSARSVPAKSNFSSTPQNAHPRTSSASSVNVLDQTGRGRQPLVDLSAPVQKETGKPLQPPTTGTSKKASPLRTKRSFKDVGKSSAPSSSSSSPPLPNSSPAVHIHQPLPSNAAEATTRKRSSTIQAGQLPSAKIHSVPLKSAPEPEPVPRFMVFRPFAHADSPPSSIGNSSWSGMLPLTPQTGSEAGGSSTSGSAGGDQEQKKNGKERRKLSVSFVEPEPEGRVEKRAKGMHRREGSEDREDPAEDKRKERRRSEAKAAIELGRVVNGPAPVVEPEETRQPFNAGAMAIPVNQGTMNSWESMQMQQYLQASQMQPQQLGAMPTLNVMPPAPSFGQFNFSNPMMSGMNMGGFGMPNYGMQMPQMPQMPHMPAMGGVMDPGMMMAHQQAMMMAKQAYQLAVAQQAMQAAGDEWERASHVGGYSSPFPPAPASIYAGSVLGVPTPSVWGGGGGASAYGRGPGSNLGYSFPMAGSDIGGPTAPNGRSVSGLGHQPQQPRQRTQTAPSSPQPPAHLRGAGAPPLPPPSSWKTR